MVRTFFLRNKRKPDEVLGPTARRHIEVAAVLRAVSETLGLDPGWGQVDKILQVMEAIAENPRLAYSEAQLEHKTAFGSKKRAAQPQKPPEAELTKGRLDNLWQCLGKLYTLSCPEASAELADLPAIVQYRAGLREQLNLKKPPPLKDRSPASIRISDMVDVLRATPKPVTPVQKRDLFLRHLFIFLSFRPSCCYAICLEVCAVSGKEPHRTVWLGLVDRKMHNDHVVTFVQTMEQPDWRLCPVKSFLEYLPVVRAALPSYAASLRYFSPKTRQLTYGHRLWPSLAVGGDPEKLARGLVVDSLRARQKDLLQDTWNLVGVPLEKRVESPYISRSLCASHLANMGWPWEGPLGLLTRGGWEATDSFVTHYWRKETVLNKLSPEECDKLSPEAVVAMKPVLSPDSLSVAAMELVAAAKAPATDAEAGAASAEPAKKTRTLPSFMIGGVPRKVVVKL